MSFIQDLKHSIRQLWRRPAFTLTAVLTLAIGMGVNAVAFTVVNGLLFKGSARCRRADDLGVSPRLPGETKAATRRSRSISGSPTRRAARSISPPKAGCRWRGATTARPKPPGCCSCRRTTSRWSTRRAIGRPGRRRAAVGAGSAVGRHRRAVLANGSSTRHRRRGSRCGSTTPTSASPAWCRSRSRARRGSTHRTSGCRSTISRCSTRRPRCRSAITGGCS